MARTIPVILGFLARLIGLGDVSGAIKKVITAIQEKVDKAIDSVIEWVVEKAKSLFGGEGRRGADAEWTQPCDGRIDARRHTPCRRREKYRRRSSEAPTRLEDQATGCSELTVRATRRRGGLEHRRRDEPSDEGHRVGSRTARRRRSKRRRTHGEIGEVAAAWRVQHDRRREAQAAQALTRLDGEAIACRSDQTVEQLVPRGIISEARAIDSDRPSIAQRSTGRPRPQARRQLDARRLGRLEEAPTGQNADAAHASRAIPADCRESTLDAQMSTHSRVDRHGTWPTTQGGATWRRSGRDVAVRKRIRQRPGSASDDRCKRREQDRLKCTADSSTSSDFASKIVQGRARSSEDRQRPTRSRPHRNP